VGSSGTTLAYFLTFTNTGAAPLDGFQIQFNKNSFGLAPAAPLELPAVAPGAAAATVLPLAFTTPPAPGAASTTLQIAIKNRQQPVWYFADAVPLPELLLPGGALERDTYLQTWKVLPPESEAVRQWPGVVLRDPEALAAALAPRHVFLTARRSLPTGEAVLYLCLQLPPATAVLVELTGHVGAPGVKACIKTANPAVAPLVFDALQALLS